MAKEGSNTSLEAKMDEHTPLITGDAKFTTSAGGSELAVSGLSYAAKSSPKSEPLLHLRNVSFTCKPGEMTAIMGKSGPWMPSLLQLLASQRTSGLMAGKITYDGNVAHAGYRHLVSLITREERFNCISNLTVRETLMYMARLRLGGNTSDEQRAERVDELIMMLGLTKCRDVRLGSETVRGISGGEKKRVGIGLGLIASPKIVLLDEPTTGLDSAIAMDVLSHVEKSVASRMRRTVVVALHMPSAEVFALFSKLVMIADGRLVYAGPADKAVEHFSSSSIGASIEARENPADFAISVVSGGRPDTDPAKTSGKALEDSFKRTTYYSDLLDELRSSASASPMPLQIHTVTQADESRQFWALFSRTLTQFYRSRSIWMTEAAKMSWICLLYSSTYWGQTESADGFSNLTACFYFSLMFGILGNLRGLITLFDERAMFENERMNRAYSSYVYWMVTSVAQVPWLCTINVVFSTTVFWCVGLGQVDNAFWVYLWYILITQLTNLVGFSMAQMLAAYCSAPAIAMAVWQPQVYIFSQTSGFPIQKPELQHYNPAWILMTISFTRWAYQGIVMAVFADGWGDVYSKSYILEEYGFQNCPLWVPVPILMFYIVAIRGLTYFPLKEQKTNLSQIGHDLFGSIVAKADQDATGKDGTMMIKPKKSSDVTPDKASASIRSVEVEVKDMHYSVNITNDDTGEVTVKPLVRGISISVSTGEIMAVMGPSGAGKSTFLDLIAARKTTGFGSGQVLYNGKEPTFAERAETEAYVMQHDVMVNTLTVYETLKISAMLRLQMPSADMVSERVQTMLEILDLESVSDKLVGTLSAGQRRLVSVAVEAVHMPSVLYLDEPTSGLDSAMALDFVESIKRFARYGCTIVCTIHQPSETIFMMFDKLLIVGDGLPRYIGTPDQAMSVLGEGVAVPDRNPAEVLMEFVQEENKKDLARNNGAMSATAASSLATSKATPHHFNLDNRLTRDSDSKEISYLATGYHLYVHIIRNLLIMKNSKRAVMVAFMRNILVAIWYGCVYFGQTTPHTLASVCYFSQQFICMSNLQAIPVFFSERALFYRERSSGLYTELPYFLARVIVNAGTQVLMVSAYSIIVYSMVGLRDGVASQRFVFFMGVMWFLSIAGYAFSNFIAAMTPNQQSAMNLYSAMFQFFMFFCGYSIPVSEVPTYWSWATHISFARYSFESLALNEFAYEEDDDGVGGTYWLDYWGFNTTTKAKTFAWFVTSVAGFHVVAWAAMKYVSYERR